MWSDSICILGGVLGGTGDWGMACTYNCVVTASDIALQHVRLMAPLLGLLIEYLLSNLGRIC